MLSARDQEPDRTLAQQYSPGSMAPALLDAHAALDALVDRAFGARRDCNSEEERQAVLFRRYAEMSGQTDGLSVAGMLAAPSQDELF